MLTQDPSSRQPSRPPWTYARLAHERAIALGSDLDPSTISAYNSHLQSYLTFCKTHQFPITPTPDTLSFYVVYMAHHISPASLPTYLSGICNRLQPFFPDVRAARASPIVVRSLAGCLKLYKTPPHRKRPLSLEDLVLATTAFQAPTHDNRLFLALLFTAFFALHCLGKLTVPDNYTSCNPLKLIRHHSVHLLKIGYTYMLPYSKADQYFEGNVVIVIHHDLTDPVPIFLTYCTSHPMTISFTCAPLCGSHLLAAPLHTPGSCNASTASFPPTSLATPCTLAALPTSQPLAGLIITFRPWVVGHPMPSKFMYARMLYSCRPSFTAAHLLSTNPHSRCTDHLTSSPPCLTTFIMG